MFAFISRVILISLSGVMAPGPITAATLTAGTRNRHSGLLIAVGHGIVEFPLMIVIVAGAGVVFKHLVAQIVIGLVGGAFLLHMGGQMLASLRRQEDVEAPYADKNPVWIGIVLTATNPYFLIWWVTVGLALSLEAKSLGPTAFIVFAVVHWLCDVVWLEILSQASHRGTQVLGRKSMPIVLAVCAIALIVFGSSFVYDAGKQTVMAVFPGPGEHAIFPATQTGSPPASLPASQPVSTSAPVQ
jgi:threonine/homoserine/homoserine lactone efflux protein